MKRRSRDAAAGRPRALYRDRPEERERPRGRLAHRAARERDLDGADRGRHGECPPARPRTSTAHMVRGRRASGSETSTEVRSSIAPTRRSSSGVIGRRETHPRARPTPRGLRWTGASRLLVLRRERVQVRGESIGPLLDDPETAHRVRLASGRGSWESGKEGRLRSRALRPGARARPGERSSAEEFMEARSLAGTTLDAARSRTSARRSRRRRSVDARLRVARRGE